MSHNGDESVFEVALGVRKRRMRIREKDFNCIELLVHEFKKAGLIVEIVHGVSYDFIKLGAAHETLGRAATELQIRKLTHVGIDLPFEWDQVEAYVRQPDGSLFNWCERLCCFHHLIYGIVNKNEESRTLRFGRREFQWRTGESLLKRMESEFIVKPAFPVHDETKRKLLLRTWALKWTDFTRQPIDEIYSYFGTKIAIYFAFLGMYTRWLFFPAAFGIILRCISLGRRPLLVHTIFFIFIVLWAVLFFQFWKRKNSALLARWQISYMVGSETGYMIVDTDKSVFIQSHIELQKKIGNDRPKERQNSFERYEWCGQLLRFRNDTIVLGIVCLQLPLELTYAYLYEVLESDIMRLGLTVLYILFIQYYTKIGGKVSVRLVKYENNKSTECSANSLVYKVFGLYFMQSYIGLFYHAILYRNFLTLQKVLIQRLIVSQVLENLLENSIPYLTYSYKKFHAVLKNKNMDDLSAGKKVQLSFRVEKEFLKPAYKASNGEELEDGLFDDFLEIALQFGMIMMFACAFPLAFTFAALNNLTEIRADALKLLVMLRRPVPRAEATIGAWLNIFQFLIVMSICTNCVLLVCLYDDEGKWKIEPGLAVILAVEHVLLLLKFIFSHFVPEEPAWVKATKLKNAAQAQDICRKQLKNLYSLEKKIG